MLTPAELTASLDSVLHLEKCYESNDGLRKRREVLNNLNILVKQWIQSVSLSRGMRWQDIDKIGGRIVTYGSYMLGISHQGADIDALCVAPQHITRKEYFSSFRTLLEYQSEVTDLRAIEEAFVPVLKMRFAGIEIDMTFARLNRPEVPQGDEDFCGRAMPLDDLDAKCVRSLNGYRSTQELLRLVPNRDTFRMTLRAVKLWAKGQGLYSNILGYLGGFSWAVLVAKTCVLNPDATAAELVMKFFELFSTWNWPDPVTLTDFRSDAAATANTTTAPPPLASAADSGSGTVTPTSSSSSAAGALSSASAMNGLLASLQQTSSAAAAAAQQQQTQTLLPGQPVPHSSWNPEKNPMERHQVMPIITPTYPHINSTFNVTVSTLKLIQEKMARAHTLCKKIFQGKEEWVTLFKTNHIFHEYHHFLVVVASANNYIQWFGLIESKIRHFLNSIENHLSVQYKLSCRSRIWPKPLIKKAGVTRQLWFVGLEFSSSSTATAENFDVAKPLGSFREALRSQARAFFSEDMKIDATYVNKRDLTGHLNDNDIQGSLLSNTSNILALVAARSSAAAGATSRKVTLSPNAVAAAAAGSSKPSKRRGGGGGHHRRRYSRVPPMLLNEE